MSGLEFIREEAAFMDNQVELWMTRLAEDPDLDVPHSVMKYFFHRCCDEKYDVPVTTTTRSRGAFGHRRAESGGVER